MDGLRWTFDTLAQHLNGSAYQISDLNPVIKQLLEKWPGSYIYGLGGHSVILWISSAVVAKVAIKQGDEHSCHEQKIFECLSQSECPSIIQCFYYCNDITFLELIGNGTLRERMSISKPRPTLSWMLQLSIAAGCLEAQGFAHGDINPTNIMFDSHDQLKLIDFDHWLKIGEDVDVGYEPYVRQHRERAGGIYGIAGPITEQFALGSVFWYMTRGSELYSDIDGYEQVNNLLNKKFPAIDQLDPIDKIISNCWNGHYSNIADIVDAIKDIGKEKAIVQDSINLGEKAKMVSLCEDCHSRIKEA